MSRVVEMTKSFSAWCLKFHKDLLIPLMFGHIELLTEKLYEEYLDWVRTDEGRKYLVKDGEEKKC